MGPGARGAQPAFFVFWWRSSGGLAYGPMSGATIVAIITFATPYNCFMRPLPIRLLPDPLVSSTVELRFEPLLDRKAVIGAVYYKLRDQFPTLDPLFPDELPESLRANDPDFSYRPQFRASNEHLQVYLGEQSITIGIVGNYPGWNVFSSAIQDIFQQVQSLNVFGPIQRVGLRYVSFFEGNIFPGLKLTLELPGYNGVHLPSSILMRIPTPDCEHTLQLANFIDQAQASGKASEVARVGTVIDIDTVPSEPTIDFFARPSYWLDLLHEAEKKLFYSLLTDEFLQTLNPEY